MFVIRPFVRACVVLLFGLGMLIPEVPFAGEPLVPGGEVLVTFPAAGSNLTTLDLPACYFDGGSLNITTAKYGGAYSTDPSADVNDDGTIEWAYTGIGYGSFGDQTEFSDDSTTKQLSLATPHDANVILPRNATLTSAKVNITAEGINGTTSFSTTDFSPYFTTNLTQTADGLSLTSGAYFWNTTTTSDFALGTGTNTDGGIADELRVAQRPSWFLPAWGYRRAISIVNGYGIDLFNYPIMVRFDPTTAIAEGKMRPDLSDVRFVNATGSDQFYWLDDTPEMAETTKTFWVNVTTIPASGCMVYMYYGNPAATAVSNRSNVFIFFDNFTTPSTWTYSETNANFVDLGYMSDVTHTTPYSRKLGIPTGGVTIPNNNYCAVSTTINVTANMNLNISAWNNGTNYGYNKNFQRMRLVVGTTTLSDVTIPQTNTVVNVPWTWRKGTYIAPGTTITIYLELAVSGGNWNGGATDYVDVWWDDVSVRQMVTPEPTVTLGGEEMPFFTSATYYSEIKQVSNASLGKINFTAYLPAGSYANITTRTGASPTIDGTWSSFSGIYASGDQVTSSPNKYIQFRVEFVTNGTCTPSLFDVNISYIGYALVGQCLFDEVTYPAGTVINWLNMTWIAYNATFPALGAYASFDGGVTWNNLSKDVHFTPPGASTRVRLGLFFVGNGSASALVKSASYEINTTAYPVNMTVDAGANGVLLTAIAGTFNTTQTFDILADLADALSAASSSADISGNFISTIPLRITSDSGGNVRLDALEIIYNYTYTLPLTGVLPSHLISPMTITIDFTSSSAGALLVGLTMMCDLPPWANGTLASIIEDTPSSHHANLTDFFHDDINDESLSFTIISENASEVYVTLDGTYINLVPAPNWFGTSHFEIGANDSRGQAVSLLFSIDVLPENDAPIISSIAPFNISQGVLTTVNFTSYISDVDNLTSELELTTNLSAPEVIVSGLTIDFNFSTPGTKYVQLYVSDGLLTTYADIIIEVINHPPEVLQPFIEVMILSNQTETIDLATVAIDPEGDALNWTVTGAETSPVLSASIVNNTLFIDPYDCMNGTETLSLNFSDGNGHEGSITVNVTVFSNCSGNLPPIITGLSDFSMLSNDTRTFNLSSHGLDPDGDALTWNITADSELVSIYVSSNILTITPQACSEGLVNVTFSLSDGNLTVSKTIRVTVINACIPLNHAPVISPIGDVTMLSNGTYTLDLSLYGSDVDGDALVWNVAESTELFNITFVGTNLTIIPGNCSEGTAQIFVTLSDGFIEANATINVTVYSSCNPMNHPPTLSAIPNVNMISNETYTLDLSPYGYDIDGDALTWYVSENSALFSLSSSGTNVTIIPESCANGTGMINITLSDGEYNVSRQVQVTIISNCSLNTLPQIVNLADFAMLSNATQTITLASHAFDADGDALTWNVTENSPLINITVAGGILTITPSNCANGTAEITFVLTDEHGAFDMKQISIMISPSCPAINHAPTIKPGLDVINVTTNDTVVVDLVPYGEDADGDTLTWTISGGNSSLFQATINAGKLYIIRVPCATGSAYLTLNLSDGKAFTTKQVLVSVRISCLPAHVAPNISAIPDQTIEGKSPITITLADYQELGTDPKPLWSVIEFDSAAVNVTLDAETSKITFARVSNAAATSTVKVQLMDSAGSFATGTITVIVKEVKGDTPVSSNNSNSMLVVFGIIGLVAAIAVVALLFVISRRRKRDEVARYDTMPGTAHSEKSAQSLQAPQISEMPKKSKPKIVSSTASAPVAEGVDSKPAETNEPPAPAHGEISAHVAKTETPADNAKAAPESHAEVAHGECAPQLENLPQNEVKIPPEVTTEWNAVHADEQPPMPAQEMPKPEMHAAVQQTETNVVEPKRETPVEPLPASEQPAAQASPQLPEMHAAVQQTETNVVEPKRETPVEPLPSSEQPAAQASPQLPEMHAAVQQTETNVVEPKHETPVEPLPSSEQPAVQASPQLPQEQQSQAANEPSRMQQQAAPPTAVVIAPAVKEESRPVATAVAIETHEEVKVASMAWKPGKKKEKDQAALKAEYESLEVKVVNFAKTTKNKNLKERAENALRLGGIYAKAGNFEKAIALLKKVEGNIGK